MRRRWGKRYDNSARPQSKEDRRGSAAGRTAILWPGSQWTVTILKQRDQRTVLKTVVYRTSKRYEVTWETALKTTELNYCFAFVVLCDIVVVVVAAAAAVAVSADGDGDVVCCSCCCC